MEVPSDYQSLSLLVEKLKPALPSSSMVKVCAQNARNGKLKAKFYSDGWPDFTTVVCLIFYPKLSEDDNIIYYSTSKEKLLLVIKEANLITWGKPQRFFCTDNSKTNYLIKNLKPPTAPQCTEEKDLSLVIKVDIRMFDLVGDHSKPQTVICPEGFILGKLEPHHAQYVSEYWWPMFAGKPWVAPLMEALITNYDSSAMYAADNPTVPVAWALLWPWGHLAHVHTMEAYRRKGLSTAVQRDLCNKVLANGDIPGAMAVAKNEPIIRLLIKQGFSESPQVKMVVHSDPAAAVRKDSLIAAN